MEKIKTLIKKFMTREIILYVVFGVLTTLVNIGIYNFLSLVVKMEDNLSNIIGIIAAILFAYFTNRKMVFNSSASNFEENFKEFTKFILGRAFTMIFQIVFFYILVTLLNLNGTIINLLLNVIVIILNFIISKFFTFKK